MGKEQLRWEKEKKVVPLVEQSQEILAWLGKLSYQWNSECIGWGSVYWSLCSSSYSLWCLPLASESGAKGGWYQGDLLVLLAQAHPGCVSSASSHVRVTSVKSQQHQWFSDWMTDKARQWLDLFIDSLLNVPDRANRLRHNQYSFIGVFISEIYIFVLKNWRACYWQKK